MRSIAQVCFGLIVLLSTAHANDVVPPLLIDGVALTDDAVVLAYAGDLWSVKRGGGAAVPLTDTPYEERFPVLSPDGSRVAYSSNKGGDWNVYVIKLGGGEPVQWTHHPKSDLALDWSPDGQRILFRTSRFGDGILRFCTVGEGDALPEELAFPQAFDGAFSPDGRRMVYAPVGWNQEFTPYRYYRGGMTSPMWIADVGDGSVDEIHRNDANHRNFIWAGDTIYFTSDETGTYNMNAYDVRSGSTTQLTHFTDYGVDAFSVRGDMATFVQAGLIYLLDLASGESTALDLRIEIDSSSHEPRAVESAKRLTDAHASEDGETIAITARGDIFIHRVSKGASTNLTNTSGVAERGAVVSPDGERVAYFSDASGEYRLVIRLVDGRGEESVLDVEDSPSFYRQLVWSPDGRWIAFTGKRLGLWLADTEDETVRKIDASDYLAQDLFHPNWSPDSRYFAYERGRPNHQHDIEVYDVEDGEHRTLTSNVDATRPVFDRNGKYLYYLASDISPMAAANRVWGLLSAIHAGPIVTRGVHAVVLQSDQPAPFLPNAPRVNEDAAIGDAVKRFRIDWDGIADRIVKVPAPARDYTGITAGGNGVAYLSARNWPEAPGGSSGPSEATYRVDFSERPTLEDELPSSQQLQCIDGGARVLMRRGASVYLQQAADAKPEKIDLGGLERIIDPVEEWTQMYREAWRMMRDYFYDADHHGQDLDKLEEHYAAYLPSVTTRTELNLLFRKMLGHVSISHMSIGGGDAASSRSRSPRIGLLGADFEVGHGRFRIKKLYRRSPAYGTSGLALAAPLDQPGLDFDEGDYILAINGKELDTKRNLFSQLTGLANKPAVIAVCRDPDGSQSREFTIVPLSGTNGLRRANWFMENAARVDKLSKGTIGYISIPQFGRNPVNGFIRQLVAASDKQGLVIDQRFNGGGITSDALVHMLIAPPLHAYDYPYGADFEVSPVGHSGPKVLITNEQNFSAAETFPLMFKIAEVGTIVGMRTGGGGTGGALHYPGLIDGGQITIPNRAGYNPRTGEWAENNGVSPDIEVQWMPEDFRAGRDPQLERAVAIAMERAKTEPAYEPKRPEYVKHP